MCIRDSRRRLPRRRLPPHTIRIKVVAVKEGKVAVRVTSHRATIAGARTTLQTNASGALEGLDGLHPKEERVKIRESPEAVATED